MEKNGFGIEYSLEGKKIYEGQWIDNMKNGDGALFDEKLRTYFYGYF